MNIFQNFSHFWLFFKFYGRGLKFYYHRKLYLFSKVHPVGAQLTMSHYRLLFPLNDDNEIDYYINQIIKRNLSKRELEVIIKSNEYVIKYCSDDRIIAREYELVRYD